MTFKGFRVFAMIFAVIGLVGAVAYALLTWFMKENAGQLIDIIGENNVKTITALGPVGMVSMIGLFALNLTSFILVTVGVHKDKMHRWYFLPGLLGAFVSIGMVIGIIYFIIALVAFFKCQPVKYEGKEADRHMITLSIVFLVVGVLGCITPLLVEFDPAYMSLSMFIGMCGVCFASTIGTYVVCSPSSRAKGIVKLLVTLLSMAVAVGLYFGFTWLLKDKAAKFDGDWPTIRTAIITACSVAGLMNFSFMVFSFRHRNYEAYIDMEQISLGIAIVGLVLANFLVLFWWLVIEAILWIWSFTFIAFVIGGFAMAAGGGGGGAPSLGEKYTMRNEKGRYVSLTYEGNGHYKGDDGSRYTETGEGTGKVTRDN